MNTATTITPATSAITQAAFPGDIEENGSVKHSLDLKLKGKAEQIRDQYKPSFDPNLLVQLFVDGLCENPGAMHIGLYARQGDQLLFAEHFAIGNGTCNEAEYIAVRSGLTLLQLAFQRPNFPVQAYSDSQLVVHQVNGRWRASGAMRAYSVALRKLQKEYPFTLTKIPREQNEIADSLAQKYVSKNSGRCLTMQDGRFNVSKSALRGIGKKDVYKAIMTQEANLYIEEYNLRGDFRELRRLLVDGEPKASAKIAKDIKDKSLDLIENAPKSNAIITAWFDNTRGLVQQILPQIIQSLETGDTADALDWIEQIAGNTNETDAFFDEQVGTLNANPSMGAESSSVGIEFEEAID